MATKKPTDRELEILSVIWRLGAATVREIHDALKATKAGGYTTTLKLVQIMQRKGFLTRQPIERTFTYQSKIRQEDIQKRLLGDLLKNAFAGSSSALIVQAINTSPLSADEAKEIRKLLKSGDKPGKQKEKKPKKQKKAKKKARTKDAQALDRKKAKPITQSE